MSSKKFPQAKWAAIVGCICLVVLVVTTLPSILKQHENIWKPDKNHNEGTPIMQDPSHGISEIMPTLFAQQELIEEIRNDIADQDIPDWTETPGAALNFAYVIPIYSTANMTENSSTILETLMFDNQYMIPAVSNGKCIGTFTIMQHEGKWTIGIYQINLDIEAELKRNEDRAACFIDVSQQSGECGFLNITDTGEEYVPISGFGTSDPMNGEQLLEKIKSIIQRRRAQGKNAGEYDG